jgi:hypothetical protein
MTTLSLSHARELQRLLVTLDEPTLVARAASHRVNREHFPEYPRRFPKSVLADYARLYWRLLASALSQLLDSAAYQAAPDHARRQQIRDAQETITSHADRAMASALREGAKDVPWPPAGGRYPERWAL